MNKQRENNKPPKSRGRPKGVPNRTTTLLKDAILKAAEKAGGKGGTVGYLTTQAKDNPVAFMGMLGKVLPLQVQGAGPSGEHVVVVRVEYVD